MKIIATVFLLFICSGCDKTSADINRGKIRHDLFVECMELAAKNTRSSDDDVSDVVSACGSQSYYISNGM